MTHKRLAVLAGAALMAVQGLVPSNAYAVGNGLPFGFRETPIPGPDGHPVDHTPEFVHGCFQETLARLITDLPRGKDAGDESTLRAAAGASE